MAIAECMEGWELYRSEEQRKEELGVSLQWGWSRVGRRGMGFMEKQPSSLTTHLAAAATVIANIDVFSTASFPTHSLGFVCLFVFHSL